MTKIIYVNLRVVVFWVEPQLTLFFTSNFRQLFSWFFSFLLFPPSVYIVDTKMELPPPKTEPTVVTQLSHFVQVDHGGLSKHLRFELLRGSKDSCFGGYCTLKQSHVAIKICILKVFEPKYCLFRYQFFQTKTR